jgi:hypothetical protein
MHNPDSQTTPATFIFNDATQQAVLAENVDVQSNHAAIPVNDATQQAVPAENIDIQSTPAIIVVNDVMQEPVLAENTDQREFGKAIDGGDMSDFKTSSTRRRYDFGEIQQGQFKRYRHPPDSVEAKKIKAAANSWSRKNFNASIFRFKDEADAICVGRVA